MGLSDWFSGLFDDGESGQEQHLLAADELQGKRERAIRKRDAARDEEDRAHEREMAARDREYAATLKASLVADRLVVVMDRLWAAEKNGEIDPGAKLANWDDEAEELAHISHGLEMLHQRFDEEREEAELDAQSWLRKYAMAHARGDDLQDQIDKLSEQYDQAIEAAGL
ncbi:hypothetical protein CJ026_022610 [Ralstonia pickettii]|uniref:Uncharacterized protein n=1 Tax=Ralstonia pickettii TaxID=329 RepID=A0ABM9IJQ6_RALPI|nr:hypothetical protein [Ralstonia pickettii]POH89450.1 hypothetical protein CJ026_022610 [Ralstonia pickettii]CAJ0722684.1 hypothetical protein R38712_01223 [Ralstonia pickettii]